MVYFAFLIAYIFLLATPVYAQEPARLGEIVVVIGRIIKLLAPVAVIAFLFMAIYAAYKFIRGRGEPKNVEEGRNILQYAVVGAALVAASWLLLKLIADVTGVNVTTVTFPTN